MELQWLIIRTDSRPVINKEISIFKCEWYSINNAKNMVIIHWLYTDNYSGRFPSCCFHGKINKKHEE